MPFTSKSIHSFSKYVHKFNKRMNERAGKRMNKRRKYDASVCQCGLAQAPHAPGTGNLPPRPTAGCCHLAYLMSLNNGI